jgi:cell division protein FtsX
MKINLVSSFAAGILLTTTICSAVYFTAPNASSKASGKPETVKVQLSEKEMKKKLTAKGYVVQKQAEYDKNLKKVKSSTKQQEIQKDKQSSTNQQETKKDDIQPAKTVTRVTVTVSEGMTSIDVGRTLEEAKIISNAFDFSKIIESRGLANKLRPGTYEVNSEMSFNELVSTIFK